MFVRPVINRVTRVNATSRPCAFCQLGKSPPIRRYASQKYRKFNRREQMRDDAQQTRFDTDLRDRNAFFKLLRNDGLLALDVNEAGELIKEFQASANEKVDGADKVRQLAEKYTLELMDITYIALPLLRIPGAKDVDARVPSQQPTIAARLLSACSAASEWQATVQILSAVYLSGTDAVPQAKDIVRLFSTADINRARAMLEKLAENGDGYCRTLQGQFLEREGQIQKARELYEQALEVYEMKFLPRYPHPMALPRTTPWIALASSLLSETSPESRAKAKAALEKGALKGDDPLAYYQLAALEDGMTPTWVKCMSKVAASGHLEAMYKLGHFYMDVNANVTAFSENQKFRKALSFVTTWKEDGAGQLAKEWFTVAATGGHKPAMLELAELHDAEGDQELAADWLRRIVQPPEAGKAEQWPRLVEQARKRLQRLATAKSRFT